MFPYLSLGPLSLPTPELSLILGFLFGTMLADRELKKSDYDPKYLDNLIWVLFLSGLVGARVSYLARNFSAFQGNFKSIFSLNPALLDPAGGFLIALTAGFIYLSKKHISYWKILDELSIFLSTFLVFINLADFASGNNHGQPTDLPWGIELWGEFRHPVQLYFIISGAIILAVVVFVFRQRHHSTGFTFLAFSVLVSASYLFLSHFRVPDYFLPGGIRLYQLLFWFLLVISLVAFNYLGKTWIPENNNDSKK
jgi:prolipoprotein diacylglyceryltransferase